MPVNTTLAGLSQTASSNGPDGAVDAPSTLDDAIRYHGAFIASLRDGKGFAAEVDVASAATCDIGAANSIFVRITGTTGITSFGTNYNGPRFLRFAGALTLTHNASSLILPGAADITTAAGDTCVAVPISGGWVVSQYQRAAKIPAFSAYQSATQAMSAGVAAKMQLQTEEFDTAGAYDTTTYRFTPQVAGYYQVNGCVSIQSTPTQIYASIYKNGVEAKRGNNMTSAGNGNVSALIYMNGSTDYLELWGFSGTSQNTSSTALTTYFQAFLARPA